MTKNYWRHIREKVDWPVFLLSGGALVAFVLLSFLHVDMVSKYVNIGFDLSIRYFGAYWQLLMIATFAVGAVLAVSKYGKVRLGNTNKHEISYFKWVAVIITTGLGAGGVFWAAAEPMYYFLEVPPMHKGILAGTKEAIGPALAQSYMSWGFTAWSVYGAISAIILIYAHNHKGMPLKPRTLLYPILGKKILTSKWGTAADVFCIIGAAAGTIGPIGFLGLQVSYGVSSVFGIPDVFSTQVLIIVGLTAVVLVSTLTGINKGIQWLSKLNVNMIVVIAVFLLIFGPGMFIIDSFMSSFGMYMSEFINISTFRGDEAWLGYWMLFFFGWFIGFGPLVALFVARISNGRKIREIFLVVAIIAPITTNFWFTVLGGTGIFYELGNRGSVSGPLLDGGLPSAIIAIAEQMPLGFIMPTVFLVLTTLFVVTTVDSMSYSISMGVTGDGNPPKIVRVFWALIMAVIATILIKIGGGGISALQSFIVVAAVPISILMLPILWYAPKIAKQLAIEQGIVEEKVDLSPSTISEATASTEVEVKGTRR
ncbi:BCCT family transporter [Sporosarcina pasteurii]|uniref:Glycine betaine transporter BetP n=1 Tax=Sporosarcina pasteurii TaxID=1474 RepID=A0A380C114_SPOPA|nr:BCCT family transporter [Sporosarcina pasteurii]MDS9471541.1 BCCT family transporter [Sporosarcina pasteurii]QBQ04843.1 BCCT family transporter [Sporosarcina pasteurii]SUJ10783.1 Glycine betaine transporter BetP [Sporosarcina pasteurii]